MVVNRKVTGTASSMPGGLLLGVGTSFLVSVLGAMVFAHLINKETLQEDSMGYCAMAVILLSSLLGSAIAVGRIKRRRVYVCALSGGIYYGTLLAMTALFFGGQYQGMAVTAVLVLIGCGIAALLGLRGEKSRRPRKSKIAHR